VLDHDDAASTPASLIRRSRHLTLRAKFALPIAVGTALLFTALVPGVLYPQSHAVLDGARDRGLQLTRVFGHSSVQAIVSDE